MRPSFPRCHEGSYGQVLESRDVTGLVLHLKRIALKGNPADRSREALVANRRALFRLLQATPSQRLLTLPKDYEAVFETANSHLGVQSLDPKLSA